ncbi:MAG: hypothetical protein OSA99_16350 [Acidimicrobiales bacterium]|nr:hypothetical protein [Acidimicrobiales bacterium]
MSDAHDAEDFDRERHPELAGLFRALDDLAAPPADASLRAGQIQRAALAARGAPRAEPTGAQWAWERAASWRVAAIAAATLAIVLGLGADDRLPEPAQKAVSSVADIVGIEVPDGSERDDPAERIGTPDTGESGTTPATPAEANGRGEPATPATPAVPGNGNSGNGNVGNDGSGNGATPADPGAPGEPATPATPPTPENNGNGPGGNGRPDVNPGRGNDPDGANGPVDDTTGNKAEDKAKDKASEDEVTPVDD